eukprot:m.1613395 g.1613395  ORF g.1613395 m.1613395 type:complete len:1317 (+) comp25368_c0_seq93:276-4226(+)
MAGVTVKSKASIKRKADQVIFSLGDTVAVEECGGAQGIVRFCGKAVHEGKALGKNRIGVEFNEPIGKNSGKVGGVAYFKCPKKHGVLVALNKVSPVAIGGDVPGVTKENPLFNTTDADDTDGYITVRVTKVPGRKMGLAIDHTDNGNFVKRVSEDGLVKETGLVKKGMKFIMICGVDVTSATKAECVDLIGTGGDNVVLVFSEDENAVAPLTTKTETNVGPPGSTPEDDPAVEPEMEPVEEVVAPRQDSGDGPIQPGAVEVPDTTLDDADKGGATDSAEDLLAFIEADAAKVVLLDPHDVKTLPDTEAQQQMMISIKSAKKLIESLSFETQADSSALSHDFRLDEFEKDNAEDVSELAVLMRQLQNLRVLTLVVSSATFLASFDELAFDVVLPVLRSVRGTLGVAPLHALALAGAVSNAAGEHDPASLARWCEAMAQHAIVGVKRARRWPSEVSASGISIIKRCIQSLQARIEPFHEDFIVCIEQFVSENDENAEHVCLGLSLFGAVAGAIGSSYAKYVQTTVRHVQAFTQVLSERVSEHDPKRLHELKSLCECSLLAYLAMLRAVAGEDGSSASENHVQQLRMYATTIVALVEDNCERKFFSARCDRMSLDLVSLVCKLFGTQATLYLTDSFTKNIIQRGTSSSDKATVTSAAKAQKNIEAIQPVQSEGEEKLGGWAPAKGKAKQIASMLHQSTEQEASKIQELSSKHESTKNKAISHEEKRLKQHKDHYRNPTPSQDALWVLQNSIRNQSGLQPLDVELTRVQGFKWQTSHFKDAQGAKAFNTAKAFGRAAIASINWTTDGFRAISFPEPANRCRFVVDSVGGAVVVECTRLPVLRALPLVLASRLTVPCPRARVISIASDEGRALRAKVIQLDSSLAHVMDQHRYFVVTAFISGVPILSLRETNPTAVKTLFEGDGDAEGADASNPGRPALSPSGLERARELGKFVAMDVLINHDTRHRVFPVSDTQPADDTPPPPPLLQINTDHGNLMLMSSLAAPLGAPMLDAYVALTSQSLDPSPEEQFDGFGAVESQRPQSVYGFGSGDEADDSVTADPTTEEASADQTDTAAVADERIPNERSNLGALHEAQATLPKSGFDKMYNLFGPSVRKKEDPDASTQVPVEDTTPKFVVYTLADHIARVRTLVDRTLDQYGTVNTLFGEEERSKEALPEFEHVRDTFAAWTGYDIGTAGVLAAQDGFVAVLQAIADAADTDSLAQDLDQVRTWAATCSPPPDDLDCLDIGAIEDIVSAIVQQYRLWLTRQKGTAARELASSSPSKLKTRFHDHESGVHDAEPTRTPTSRSGAPKKLSSPFLSA